MINRGHMRYYIYVGGYVSSQVSCNINIKVPEDQLRPRPYCKFIPDNISWRMIGWLSPGLAKIRHGTAKFRNPALGRRGIGGWWSPARFNSSYTQYTYDYVCRVLVHDSSRCCYFKLSVYTDEPGIVVQQDVFNTNYFNYPSFTTLLHILDVPFKMHV